MNKAFLSIQSGNVESLENELDNNNLTINEYIDNDNGNTLLHAASIAGSKRMIKLLLRRGININSINRNLNTAAHLAFQFSYNEIGRYLISKGCDDSLLNIDGHTCYEMHYMATNTS
mgnify:CR=1 FL=1